MNKFEETQRERRLGPVVCVLLWVLSSSVVYAADPFYERLFQDGTLAQENGAHGAAARKLRLACFGMLEQPALLAKCLTHLALAQASLEQEEDFLGTLGRILELERRFEAFSKAELTPRRRQEFESWLQRWASFESIADLPAFRGVAEAKRAQQLRELPIDERRLELDRRLALEPNHPRWRLMWAELEWQTGNYEAAAKAADGLLTRQPANTDARCVRGLANEKPGGCGGTTVADLTVCSSTWAEPAAEARLRCSVASSQWQEAQEVFSAMPEQQQRKSEMRRLAKRIRKGLRSGGSARAISAPPTTEVQPVAAVAIAPEPAGPASSDSLTTAERARLEDGRKALKAYDRPRFESLYGEVQAIADRRQKSGEAQQLVAEIAYRLTRWEDAARYFRRAEKIGPLTPDFQFYLAISLYKSGDQAAAVELLDRCLPQIAPSDFVAFWAKRIRGESG